jgi:hypothetical protein
MSQVQVEVTLLDKVFPNIDRKAVYVKNKDIQINDVIHHG